MPSIFAVIDPGVVALFVVVAPHMVAVVTLLGASGRGKEGRQHDHGGNGLFPAPSLGSGFEDIAIDFRHATGNFELRESGDPCSNLVSAASDLFCQFVFVSSVD